MLSFPLSTVQVFASVEQNHVVVVFPDIFYRVERHGYLIHPGDLVAEPVLSEYLVQDEPDMCGCSPIAVVVERPSVFQDAFNFQESGNHHGVVGTLVRCADILEPREINGQVKHGSLVVDTGFVGVAAVVGNKVPSSVERRVCVDKIDGVV